MKKEIIEIDQAKGVYRITTTDERWYTQTKKNEETGLPFLESIPSITWICSFYPKGTAFYKWLAGKGWDEAEALKSEAGDKGSKVHKAVEMLMAGNEIKMEDKYFNNSSEEQEDLGVDEYKAACSFKNWYDKEKPEFILSESTVFSNEYKFAGTVDAVVKIGDITWIIDFKTSQYIWPSMEIQISAYKQALKEMGRNVSKVKLAILQLGYKKNKAGYKFTEIEDQFDLFLAARKIWEKEASTQSPKQIELPLSLKLDIPKKVEGKAKKVITKK